MNYMKISYIYMRDVQQVFNTRVNQELLTLNPFIRNNHSRLGMVLLIMPQWTLILAVMLEIWCFIRARL